jgi:hypothetical protein
MAAVTGGTGPVGEVGADVEVGAVGAVVLLIGLLDARVTLGCRGNVAIANVTNRLV